MSNKITLGQVKTAIICGEFDIDLDDIRQIIQIRREVLAGALKRSLNVRDRVTFSEECSPAYLRGRQATVVKINRDRIVVDLDSPAGRFHRGIVCPVSIFVV